MDKKEITEEMHLEKKWFEDAKNQTLETLPAFMNNAMQSVHALWQLRMRQTILIREESQDFKRVLCCGASSDNGVTHQIGVDSEY